jgi:hypothetical protein
VRSVPRVLERCAQKFYVTAAREWSAIINYYDSISVAALLEADFTLMFAAALTAAATTLTAATPN